MGPEGPPGPQANIQAHLEATDPHPQYLTTQRADQRYALIGAGGGGGGGGGGISAAMVLTTIAEQGPFSDNVFQQTVYSVASLMGSGITVNPNWTFVLPAGMYHYDFSTIAYVQFANWLHYSQIVRASDNFQFIRTAIETGAAKSNNYITLAASGTFVLSEQTTCAHRLMLACVNGFLRPNDGLLTTRLSIIRLG